MSVSYELVVLGLAVLYGRTYFVCRRPASTGMCYALRVFRPAPVFVSYVVVLKGVSCLAFGVCMILGMFRYHVSRPFLPRPL